MLSDAKYLISVSLLLFFILPFTGCSTNCAPGECFELAEGDNRRSMLLGGNAQEALRWYQSVPDDEVCRDWAKMKAMHCNVVICPKSTNANIDTNMKFITSERGINCITQSPRLAVTESQAPMNNTSVPSSNSSVASQSTVQQAQAQPEAGVAPEYQYYNRCNSFGSENCYSDIVHNCGSIYPPNDTSAPTQFRRMGCIADSIYAQLSPSSHQYQTFLSHYLIRKGYFEAAIIGEIPAYQAYQMSELLRNQLNANLSNQYSGSAAKKRCMSRCLMNNKAGSGGSGIVQGLNYCANMCN